MRYLSWDVLLFPDDSKTPVQEFDIRCHALPVQPEDLPSSKMINLAGDDIHSSVTQLATLTCFIPSLDAGRTFRISIHSWEKPRPSKLLLQFKPEPQNIIFEARLSIDGKLTAQRFIGENNTWPEVFEYVQTLDLDYDRPLRFPPFHSEILKQSHWDASDGLGRIRIIISEGIAHTPHSNVMNRGYHRFRDIVAFSFQHAPRKVLEHSGIAWPNVRMFATPPVAAQRNDFDAHAHSPQRSGSHYSQKTRSKPSTVRLSSAEDPFVDRHNHSFMQIQRKPNSDISMADYPMSKHASEMSGVAIQQPDLPHLVNQAAVDEIIRALTPTKRVALLSALSPPTQPGSESSSALASMTKSVPWHRMVSLRSFNPSLPAHSSSGNMRKFSAESRRTTSGTSTVMSWDETPTLGELWSNNSNDFPGLLPAVQSSARSDGSNSMLSKRKRSMSPVQMLQNGNNALTNNLKGMSTSPLKKSPTPRRDGTTTKCKESRSANAANATMDMSDSEGIL